MRKKSGLIIVMVVIFGALGVLIFGSFFGSLISEHNLDQRGVRATATATLADCGYHKAIEGDYAHVDFVPAGHTQTVSAKLLVTEQACRAINSNPTVAIVYDPLDPTVARMADLNGNNPFWRNELFVFGVSAAIIAAIGLFYFVSDKLKRR